MKADYQSYKRAASVCLLGLFLQLAMGLTLLVHSVLSHNHAGLTGALYILLGGVVWLSLAIVFDQHRRERIEALEAEAIAQQGGRALSVFGEGASELRVAAKRLAGMHRVMLPVVSLLYAAALAGIGLWRFRSGEALIDHGSFKPFAEHGWAISIGIALAFVGFMFARYVAGMAKQPVWANLRGGAAQAVGAALVGLAIAVTRFIDYMGTDAGTRYLQAVLPALMIALSIEVVLNFLLGIYRPRRPGEVPRPAMDSRVLSFVAAPDRIAESIGGALNYQFGFDVTGSWFYQLLSRSLSALVVVGVAVLWLMTTVGVVQPNEQGVRVRLGRLASAEPLPPGPYLKLPWPLERIERFDTERVRRINVAGEAPTISGAILWTNDHKAAESFFLVQPAALERTAGVATGDYSLVAAEIPLYYRVDDVIKFHLFAAPEAREQVIRAEAQREVLRYMAAMNVDDVLGRGRSAAAAELHRRISARLAELNTGVGVLFVGIEGVHPPRETAEEYEKYVGANQEREALIDMGQREASEMLINAAGSLATARRLVALIDDAEHTTDDARRAELEAEISDLIAKAGGQAAVRLQEARAERWQRHMTARAEAEAYAGELAMYRAAPRIYAAGRYFETLRDLIKDKRVYFVRGDGVEVRVNLEDSALGGNLFEQPRQQQE